MNLTDHRRRVERLLRGGRNVTDLDRLFSDLRFSDAARSTVREIGHFSAHRDERDKGIVMTRASEIQASGQAWMRQMNGAMPTLEEAKTIAQTNLKIITDQRLEQALGVKRQQARSNYLKAWKKLAKGKVPKGREATAFEFLSGSFMWETAFNNQELMEDFTNALITTGALDSTKREEFYRCEPFVSLHALTVMHMSRLLLPDGNLAPLRLKIRQETGTLRIKAHIPLVDRGKSISVAVSVFETNLDAKKYSKIQPEIEDYELEVPIEIGRDGMIEELV